MSSKGRGGHRWRRLQARVYRTETVCALCGKYVDQTLPWPHPMSRSVDHIVSVRDAPELALERTNCQLAHLIHNQQKAAKPEWKRLAPTSRDW